MALDPAAAAKLVESLDQELAKRQSRKDAAQDAQWERECGGDSLILMARRLSRAWDRFLAKPPTAVPMSVDDLECAVEDALDYAKSLFALADAVERDERRKEAEASGAPRRKPTIIGPRVRAAAPSAKAKPTVDILAKADGAPAPHRRSRTEAYLEKMAAESAAKQALMPQRQGPPAPPETAMGWFRGLIASFDQRTAIGLVKFSGAAGFSEAPLAPGAFRGSGLTVLIPNQAVDAEIMRRPDGSVFIQNIRLSGSLDPQASAAEQAAADAERFRVPLGLRRYH